MVSEINSWQRVTGNFIILTDRNKMDFLLVICKTYVILLSDLRSSLTSVLLHVGQGRRVNSSACFQSQSVDMITIRSPEKNTKTLCSSTTADKLFKSQVMFVSMTFFNHSYLGQEGRKCFI